MLSLQQLLTYWNGPPFHANLLIILNLIGALLLGMVIGYERAYHGRAAGGRRAHLWPGLHGVQLMGEKTCEKESKLSLARIVNELPIVDSFSLETARQ